MTLLDLFLKDVRVYVLASQWIYQLINIGMIKMVPIHGILPMEHQQFPQILFGCGLMEGQVKVLTWSIISKLTKDTA